MAVRISCINKDERYNPYEAITYVGGKNADGTRWKMTKEDAIQAIENNKYQFYVDVDNDPVGVIVAISPYYNKYLKTKADGDKPNNLLSLDECPLWKIKLIKEVIIMKKPTKKQLSEAGRKLRNPHTPEKKESKYAKILAAGRKRKR